MLLDLGRNDVGRVAKVGTVHPTEEFIIERYSHVMHIVSNVVGELREGEDSLSALLAAPRDAFAGDGLGDAKWASLQAAVELARRSLQEELRRGVPSHVTADLTAAPQLTADEIRERMSGNICRCGAYSNIADAMADVAGVRA